MTARTRHYASPAAFAETSTEAAYNVLCDTTPKQGTTLWATINRDEVTCKKCLKALADIDAEAREVADKINAAIAEAERLEEAEHPELTDLDTPEVLGADTDLIIEDEPIESFYSKDLYATPTGPLVELRDVVIPTSFGDRDIAARHGLERHVVENAINDGWLKR